MPKNRSKIVFLGTYPPRECGIATFNQDLLKATQKNAFAGTEHQVAAFNVSRLDNYVYPSEVKWQIDQGSRAEHENLAKKINEDNSVLGVVLQHEYGIYGGEDGENILHFVNKCTKPILVTLHTVLPTPTPKMFAVTNQIIKNASVIVVLTDNSRKVLETVYKSAIGKTYVVPHGIPATAFTTTKLAKKRMGLGKFTVLSTFGLLSRGKGIEHVINALPAVVKKYPSVLYLILGKTHPVVRRVEGEKYRNELIEMVNKLHLKKHVKFYDQYLNLKDLIAFLKATDVYVSTSTNPNQAVSGTLSYALGVGRAVVSTEFAQALEIVTEETGKLVPINDSRAMSKALFGLLKNKRKLQQMHKNAYINTRHMLWSNVALKYASLLKQNTLPRMNIAHLRKMTDKIGLLQFAKYDKPYRKYGYTLDDNARALVVCSILAKNGYQIKTLEKLTSTYLNFIEKCILPDGTFINYLKYKSGKPTKQNKEEDLEEALARAIWALSEIMINKEVSSKLRNKAQKIFLKCLPTTYKFRYLRSTALSIKAYAKISKYFPRLAKEMAVQINRNAIFLESSLKQNSSNEWFWFEDFLGYNNAILPESLLIAGDVLKNQKFLKKGEHALEFLISKTFSENYYQPIGQSAWYKKDGERSLFDQQAEDPASSILALATAYKITQNEVYKNLAFKCFSWFLGNNAVDLPIYNEKNGGVYDGLQPDKVNKNEGAESLVSYLLARLIIAELKFSQNYENPTNKKHLSKFKSSKIQFGGLAKT